MTNVTPDIAGMYVCGLVGLARSCEQVLPGCQLVVRAVGLALDSSVVVKG